MILPPADQHELMIELLSTSRSGLTHLISKANISKVDGHYDQLRVDGKVEGQGWYWSPPVDC